MRSTTQCFSTGLSSLFAEGKKRRNLCTLPWGSSPIDEGESSVCGSLRRREERPESRMFKDLKRRGVQGVWVFVTDDLPGLEESIKGIFPEVA